MSEPADWRPPLAPYTPEGGARWPTTLPWDRRDGFAVGEVVELRPEYNAGSGYPPVVGLILAIDWQMGYPQYRIDTGRQIMTVRSLYLMYILGAEVPPA